jgi:hypothetical protein
MMTEGTPRALATYFPSTKSHFWRWSPDGRAIEHSNGPTICFREELEDYLGGLHMHGLPILTPLVMLVAACRDNFEGSDLEIGDISLVPSAMTETVFAEQVTDLFRFLRRVHQLPKQYRSVPLIHLLLKAVLVQEEMSLDADDALDLFTAYKAGQLDAWVTEVLPAGNHEAMAQEVSVLIAAAQKYPTIAALQNAIETGLEAPPQVAEVPIPEIQTPESAPPALIVQLLEDPRTCGIASLAQQVIAALHIPMQARGSADLPLGGVSDITNRGDYDRLLLSELANDDLALMARLANNEALFLRREEPPVNVERERIVLIDTTIKVWGLTRAFAIAAALGCQARNLPGYGFQAFTLGGDRFVSSPLDTLDGVVQTLALLNPSLHPALGLEKCLAALPKSGREVIFITASELLQDPAFNLALIALQPQLDYLITVNRDGELHLIELFQGHRRLLSQAKFDLEDLLFRQPKLPQRASNLPNDLPAFFHDRPAPMYFPATSIRLRPHLCCVLSPQRIIVLTESRRALLWQSGQTGALELFSHIAVGDYLSFDETDGQYIFIRISSPENRNQVTVYCYDTVSHRSAVHQLNAFHYSAMRFLEGHLYYRDISESGLPHRQILTKRNCLGSEDVIMDRDVVGIERALRLWERTGSMTPLKEMRKVINPGYSSLQQLKYISVTRAGYLRLDTRMLHREENEWRLLHDSSSQVRAAITVRAEDALWGQSMPGYGEMRLRRFAWKDGSHGWVDPRGLLHLRSSDPKLPEITLVLIIDAPTAMWASNGDCTGSPYFLGAAQLRRLSAATFAAKYLHPFIQCILSAS